LQAKVSKLEGELAEAREQLLKYQNDGANSSKNPNGKDKEELLKMEAKKFAICHMLWIPSTGLSNLKLPDDFDESMRFFPSKLSADYTEAHKMERWADTSLWEIENNVPDVLRDKSKGFYTVVRVRPVYSNVLTPIQWLKAMGDVRSNIQRNVWIFSK
jgi:hypothetical protein